MLDAEEWKLNPRSSLWSLYREKGLGRTPFIHLCWCWPIWATNSCGRGTEKTWGCLFTYLTTCAVYLGVTPSPDTNDFIMVLSQFIFRGDRWKRDQLCSRQQRVKRGHYTLEWRRDCTAFAAKESATCRPQYVRSMRHLVHWDKDEAPEECRWRRAS